MKCIKKVYETELSPCISSFNLIQRWATRGFFPPSSSLKAISAKIFAATFNIQRRSFHPSGEHLMRRSLQTFHPRKSGSNETQICRVESERNSQLTYCNKTAEKYLTRDFHPERKRCRNERVDIAKGEGGGGG